MTLTKTIAAAVVALFAAFTVATAAEKATHALSILPTFSAHTWQVLVLAQFAAYGVLIMGCAALLTGLAFPTLKAAAAPFVWLAILVLVGFLAEDALGLSQPSDAGRKDAIEMVLRLAALVAIVHAFGIGHARKRA